MIWVRLPFHVAGVLILLILTYLAAGTIGGLIPSANSRTNAPPAVEIFLISGPIHTDFVLPATEQTRDTFGFVEPLGVPLSHPNVEWIVVGWGAEQFYTTTGSYHDLTIAAVWRAITGDNAVMRFDVLGRFDPNYGFSRLTLSQTQYDALLARLLRDARPDPSDRALSYPGFGQTDRFIPARGHFSALNTCNVWVGDVLRDIGVPVGFWTPFNWTLP